MVLGAIGKFSTLGVVLLITILFFRRAFETGSLQSAGADLGGAVGSIGTGIQTGLGGIGTGLSSLFNPLFTFLDFGKKAQDLFANLGGNGSDSREIIKSNQTSSRPRESNQSSGSTSIFSAGSGLPK